MEFDNTNKMTLWVNRNKTKDTAPAYTGIVNIDGVERKISVWEKKNDDGSFKLFSGSIQTAEEAEKYNKPKGDTEFTSEPVGIDDDIPF